MLFTESSRLSPVDQPVAVGLTGLIAGQSVTVSASATDPSGILWTAAATFVADQAGRVDLGEAPRSGSYRGANRMGLIESMSPTRATKDVFLTALTSTPRGYTVDLSAAVNHRVVARTELRREVPAAQTVVVTQERPGATGVFGALALPERPVGLRPAVLVLGGSEGGLETTLAAELLAEHGFPALALAYFGEPGLPSSLADIPLEYFARGLTLLSRQPGVDPQHLLVWGTSRGSEAALLLGADYPGLVHGVIAAVPSSTVNPGYPDPRKPTWTWHGYPLPSTSTTDFDDPDPTGTPDAVIKVENINGPVMTICAGDDHEWLSCPYAAAIASRRKTHSDALADVALAYPRAGHLIGALIPYTSGNRNLGDTGGTPYLDATARDDAWPKLLEFLSRRN